MWRMVLMLLPTMLVAGCVASSRPAVCSQAVERLAKAHASALLEDGGDRSVVTGRRFIGAVAAGCGW